MIVGNSGTHGELNPDCFQRAMLTYRNTPDPETNISPAMCIFGRPTRNTTPPIIPGKYKSHPTWRETLQNREDALRIRHYKIANGYPSTQDDYHHFELKTTSGYRIKSA